MGDGALTGTRVLVVEDEALISLVLQDMLDEFGCSVAGVAETLAEALPLAEADGYDVAILDVHLGGDLIYPVADAVRARGRPIILATGSGRETLPARFHDAALLAKPYALAAVEQALLAACTNRPATPSG